MLGIDWRDAMSVGVKEIDDQHKQLIATISELNDAIIKKQVETVLIKTFDRLSDYVKTHFVTEENYFDQFKYEEADEHKAAHRFFGDRLMEMNDKINGDIHELSLELVAFLEFWLVGHVMVMDQRYVKCFHDNGLK